MSCKVTYCTAHTSVNTRPHQLGWLGDEDCFVRTWTNCKKRPDVMQIHPLCKFYFGQYQAGLISCARVVGRGSGWTINGPHLPDKTDLDVMQSPTVQDAIWSIPGLISCAGLTGMWGLLSHTQNTVRCTWLALSKRSVETSDAVLLARR